MVRDGSISCFNRVPQGVRFLVFSPLKLIGVFSLLQAEFYNSYHSMENTNEGEAAVELNDAEAVVDELNEATEEEKDTTDWKAKYEEAEGQRKRLETKLGKVKITKEAERIIEKQSKGELDNGDYAFLATKGYEDDDQIAFIQKQMDKWDMSLREILKDEEVKAKLAGILKAKEVQAATPSGTRRATNQMNDLDYLYAKFEQTGELPTDYDMKTKVLDRKIAKENTNKPRWK